MKATYSKRVFLLFFIIIAPLFLNLNFSAEIRFDASPFNKLGMPSLPLILIVLSVLGVLNVLNYRFKIIELLFIFLLIVTIFFSYSVTQNLRLLFLAFGMLMPLFFAQIIVRLLRFTRVDFSKIDFVLHFYLAISIMIIVKFTSDVVFYGAIYSEYFISNKVVIYNSYDYFPIVYVFSITLSINNIYNGNLKKFSILIILISLSCALMSHSRLFAMLSIISIPVYIIFRKVKFSFGFITVVTTFFCAVITIGIALVSFKTDDQSLITRFGHWMSFFESLQSVEIILPFLNTYRGEMNWGTFHNELLEIYSFFGFLLFLYLYILSNQFKSYGKYKYSLKTLLFFFLIGSLVQLNLTNPYIALVVSALFSSLKCNQIGLEDKFVLQNKHYAMSKYK